MEKVNFELNKLSKTFLEKNFERFILKFSIVGRALLIAMNKVNIFGCSFAKLSKKFFSLENVEIAEVQTMDKQVVGF